MEKKINKQHTHAHTHHMKCIMYCELWSEILLGSSRLNKNISFMQKWLRKLGQVELEKTQRSQKQAMEVQGKDDSREQVRSHIDCVFRRGMKPPKSVCWQGATGHETW